MRKLCLALGLVLAASLAPAQEEHCVRGEASPLVSAKAPGVANVQFKRISAVEAIEDVTLAHGERFRFEHGGCEYYVVAFTVWPRHARGTRLQTAADGLRQLALLKVDTVFDLKAAAAAMERLQRAGTPPVDGEEHPVEGDGEDFLQTRFVFDAAPRGAVHFRLLKGPL